MMIVWFIEKVFANRTRFIMVVHLSSLYEIPSSLSNQINSLAVGEFQSLGDHRV